MVETELVVKIAGTGARQTIKDVLGLQDALEGVGDESQLASKEARDAAKKIGQQYKLTEAQVEQLANRLDKIDFSIDDGGALRNAQGQLIKIADSADELGNRLQNTQKEASGLGLIFEGFIRRIGEQAFDALIQSFQRLGQAIIDVGRQAIQEFGEFDAARAAAATLTNDVDTLVDRLGDAQDRLENQVSTTDLVASSYDILSAGFTDAADAALIAEESARGAIAGFSDAATVADALTTVLNAYNLEAEDSTRIVDQLAQTQNLGKITIDQYAQGIGRAAGIAATAGVSFEELSAAVAAATAAGVPAESAIRGVRQAIINLQKPTADAQKTLEQFGITNATASLRADGLVGILQQLADQGATSDQLAKIFSDVDGLATILPIAGENIGRFTSALEGIEGAAGTADAAIEEITNTLPALEKALQITIREGLLEFGKALEPVSAAVIGLANDILSVGADEFSGFDPLIEAGERLQAVLEGNPEIAEQLGRAFATLADEAVNQFARIIDAVTAFLSTEGNVEEIADQIEKLAGAIQLAGQTARFLIALADGVGQLVTAAEELPIVGDNIDRFLDFPIPINLSIEAIRGMIEIFQSLGDVVIQVVDGTLQQIERFTPILKPIIDQLQRLLNQIDSPDPKAIDGIGIAATSSSEAIEKLDGKLTDLNEGLDDQQPTPPPGPEAVEAAESAIDGLAEANRAALDQIALDATNAEAALLETGGTQEQLAQAEAEALQRRVTQNKTFLAELQALQTGSLSAEDAAKVAEQIAQVEQQLAQDRVAIAKNQVDQQSAIEDQAKRDRIDAAKEQADEIKTQRERERDAAKEAFEGTAEQAEQAYEDETIAAERAFEDRVKGRQAAVDAEIEAINDVVSAAEDALNREFDQLQESLSKAQAARQKALQERQAEEREAADAEFAEREKQIERELALEAAASPQERRELQAQFASEDDDAERREKAFAELEEDRRKFEEQQRREQEKAQEAAIAAQEALDAEREQRELELQNLKVAAEEEIAAKKQALEAELLEAKRAFEDAERETQRAFETQQQQAEAQFNAEQRRLDEASAERIRAILAQAERGVAPEARRDGGPVRAGKPYLVGESGPELITPRRSGYVHTAQETAAMMGQLRPSLRGLAAPQGNTGAIERKLDKLISEVRAGRRVPLPPAQYTLNTQNPVQDTVAIEMARLRAMVRKRGL